MLHIFKKYKIRELSYKNSRIKIVLKVNKFYLLFLAFIISCTDNSTYVVLDSSNLVGNVESVKEISYLVAYDSVSNSYEIVRQARKKNDEDDFIMYLDKEGRIFSKKYFIKEDTIKRVSYDYRDSNYYIKKIEDINSNIIYSHYTWEMDNTMSNFTANKDNVVLNRCLYLLNRNNSPEKEIIYYATGDIAYTKEYFYKDYCMIEEQWINSNDEIFKKNAYQYNSRGNVIKEIQYLGPDSIYMEWEYEYEYDSIGNWVSRKDYHSKVPTFIILRQINYYK